MAKKRTVWVHITNTPVAVKGGMSNGWHEMITEDSKERLLEHLHIDDVSEVDPTVEEVEEEEEKPKKK